jgi:hypothetical protein
VNNNKLVITVLMIVIALSGCADSVSFESGINEVGFLHGFWHGVILPVSFLISLFDDNVAVYAIYNSGGWYDFGFFLGVGALSSSAT